MPDDRAINDLGARLARPSFRREFVHSPFSAIERAGIDTKKLPESVIDTLSDLSPEELRVVGNLQGKLANDPDLAGFTGGVIF